MIPHFGSKSMGLAFTQRNVVGSANHITRQDISMMPRLQGPVFLPESPFEQPLIRVGKQERASVQSARTELAKESSRCESHKSRHSTKAFPLVFMEGPSGLFHGSQRNLLS